MLDNVAIERLATVDRQAVDRQSDQGQSPLLIIFGQAVERRRPPRRRVGRHFGGRPRINPGSRCRSLASPPGSRGEPTPPRRRSPPGAGRRGPGRSRGRHTPRRVRAPGGSPRRSRPGPAWRRRKRGRPSRAGPGPRVGSGSSVRAWVKSPIAPAKSCRLERATPRSSHNSARPGRRARASSQAWTTSPGRFSSSRAWIRTRWRPAGPA